MVVQAGHHWLVDVARAATAAFGKQHHRQLEFVREREHTVGFLMIACALGAGQHGVVVGHDDATRFLRAMGLDIDGADARDHAIRRGVGDQVVQTAAAGLRGNGQRAIFHEAAFITQLPDVFAGGATPLGVALGHGGAPVGVPQKCVAVLHGFQVISDHIQILLGLLPGILQGHFHRLQHQQQFIGGNVAARRDHHCLDATRSFSQDHVFHFHGFNHRHLRALGDEVANAHVDLHQLGGHGRVHAVLMG